MKRCNLMMGRNMDIIQAGRNGSTRGKFALSRREIASFRLGGKKRNEVHRFDSHRTNALTFNPLLLSGAKFCEGFAKGGVVPLILRFEPILGYDYIFASAKTHVLLRRSGSPKGSIGR